MSQDSGFVFNLFLKHKLHPFYSNPIRNKVTKTDLPPLPLIENSGKPSSFFMVTDIPDYLEAPRNKDANSHKIKKIRQYQGFLCDLSGCDTTMDYLKVKFNKKVIKNINAKKRQLETRHSITYEFHYGSLDKSHYDFLMDRFYVLLRRRFDEKKMYNRYLLQWGDYYELIYPMILAKQASLLVISDGKEPIAMALDFYVGDIAFGYIQVFDPDYGKYYMGDLCMIKRLEWLLDHEYKIFDFLMGTNYYKIKWSNKEYYYHHHLYYRSSSPVALAKMYVTLGKIRLMHYLRKVGVLGKMFDKDKYLYRKMSKKLAGFNWRNP